MGKARGRRPLSPAEKVAQQNLRRLWDEKAKGLGLTQEIVGARAQWSSPQSATSQYLNGILPLNTDATLHFARQLRVEAWNIDPRLKETLRVAEPAPVYAARETEGLDAVRLAEEELRAIGARIEERRKVKQITVTKLIELTKLPTDDVFHVLANGTDNLAVLARFAKALHDPIDLLVFGLTKHDAPEVLESVRDPIEAARRRTRKQETK